MSAQVTIQTQSIAPSRTIQVIDVTRSSVVARDRVYLQTGHCHPVSSSDHIEAANTLITLNSATPRPTELRAPSKAAVKSGKPVRSVKRHRNRQAQEDLVRQQWKSKAKAIVTPRGTQANNFQLFVMNWVYRDITPYPDEVWFALIALGINRAPQQIKHWFSNQRQQGARTGVNRVGKVEAVTVDGREMRLCREALANMTSQGPWTDIKFKTELERVIKGQRDKFQAQLAAC